jgi:glycosyltransferase involved in cell wall biosynthesis
MTSNISDMSVALIGCAGVPNRYGGFEAFAEHCGPEFLAHVRDVRVTCDRRLYAERSKLFNGLRRVFIPIPANGAWSIVHDMAAFLAVFSKSSHIVVLGVSGGPWFPLWRLLCEVFGKSLIVNIDGVEWRRAKFSKGRRRILRLFDSLAQRFAHRIIYDSPALLTFVIESCKTKATCIAYSGDHVIRLANVPRIGRAALTICRIEPENHIEMIIEGFLKSRLDQYTVVGNWSHGDYGHELKRRYQENPRLRLLDPVYDPHELAVLRESCSIYLHGHSVGGTNPSLVEMIFYDCALVCFDCDFNRETAKTSASYFDDAISLAALLDSQFEQESDRSDLRSQYTRGHIAQEYIQAMSASR